jgi:DNA polymerase
MLPHTKKYKTLSLKLHLTTFKLYCHLKIQAWWIDLKSYQNLILLQNLYRLRAIGFEYIDHFTINEVSTSSVPDSLDTLSKQIQSCHLCDLSKSRRQSMPGYGSDKAKLFILDFMVSSAQDSANRYYSGRSGESLKNMIEKVIGMSVKDVYMTHLVKCKPLHSNQVSDSEIESCKHYLFSQLEFIQPDVIVCLGEDAYSGLTGNAGNFDNVRGHIIDFKKYKLIPIYHPNYLLRNPELKKITLHDLHTIKSCL